VRNRTKFNFKYWIYSILIHLSIFTLAIIFNFQNRSTQSEQIPPELKPALEVKTISENEFSNRMADILDEKKNRIVQTDDRLKVKSKPNPNEKIFESKTNQYAKKNTKSKNFGEFKNDLYANDEKKVAKKSNANKSSKSKKVTSKDLLSFSLTDGLNTKTKRETSSLNESSGEAGQSGQGSATDDYLPDVAVGAQTLLNANENKYYTFYERIRRRLKSIWYAKVSSSIENLEMSNQSHLLDGTKISGLIVYLNKNGDINKIEIDRYSGVKELDKAALDSFNKAGPFPRPPKGLINPNTNLIEINWEFVLMTTPEVPIKYDVRRRN